jgi:DNA-binding NtrC family response regulator
VNQVLVVDDEAGMRAGLEASFLRHGWQVDTASGAAEALEKFRRGQPPLVVTDIRMPDGDGLEVMRAVRAVSPSTAVILLTAYGNVPQAVEAMRQGACDYLIKPVSFVQLHEAAQRVLTGLPSGAAVAGKDKERIVGTSLVLRRALDRAHQVAGTDADVLIEAESGTGKELLARLIHSSSPRRHRAFVAVNCAAFPEHLLESELFGHAKGAFTGAIAAKPGKFELAHGGTLLLDEVGEMPLSLQPKLLRVLQEREFDRLGDTRSIHVDLRIVATSNRSLPLLVKEAKFRADLYYRLNVIPLSLPPLRERREDIPELCQHFLRLYAPANEGLHLSPAFLARLAQHTWPGNVRELANCMRRAVVLCRELEITEDLLADLPVEDAPASREDGVRAGLSLRELERQLLVETLAATAGNRSRAAAMLGVSLRTVRNKIRQHGLPPRSLYARS